MRMATCRQIAPIISELAAEYGARVKIVKMDIDKNPGTPGQFGIRAIPTILAFKGGRVVQQIQGARPKADFKKAPSFDTDTELSLSDEAATFAHYSLEYTPAGEGARRLAKR